MGFFNKIVAGLAKTRDSVLREIKGAFGKGKLTDEAIENLEEKLLAADIGYETTHLILEGVRKKARGLEIDQDQLLHFMAEVTRELLPETIPTLITAKPHVLLMIGVNGAGKTTTIAKLAHHHRQAGRKVIVAAGDTFRAGAIAQLDTWAQRAGVDIIKHQEGADAAAVAYDAYAAAKARGHDVLIIDTAGRLHTKDNLMEELRKMLRVLKKHGDDVPHETLLVLDGNTGQNAIAQGQGFSAVARIDGLVVTKLDGTAKGGSLIPLTRAFKIPVRWIGVGEGMEDLVPFSRDAYVKGLFLGE
jgi:fused signal recognition particle receptor